MTEKLFNILKNEYNAIKLDFDVTQLKGKTFFITGSNGLIGSNMINFLYLLNLKYNLNLKLIAHSFSPPVSWLPQDNCITYLNSDLTEETDIPIFDYLVHAATYGQPKKFIQNKLGTVKLNTEVLINLLEKSMENNSKVLFLSSSEVYGQVPVEIMPVKENYLGNVDTLSDRAVYAESKRIAETICNIFSAEGLHIKIARLAIAYGPGVKYSDSRFMNEFIKRALNDGALTMKDSGKATRCFCFITDMIEMLLNTMFASKDILYNLAGIENKTIIEVAQMIAQKTKVPLHVPNNEEKICGTPSQLSLSIDKYCNEFNKHNFIPLEKGIEKTIDWIKQLNTKEINI